MTVELTRRIFLIGSAAAVATTNPLVRSFPVEPVRLASHSDYIKRVVHKIDIGFDHDKTDKFATVIFDRYPKYVEPPLFQVGLNQRAFYSWWAVPGGELFFPRGSALRIDVSSDEDVGVGRINVFCCDTIEGGKTVELVERYAFKNGELIERGFDFLDLEATA